MCEEVVVAWRDGSCWILRNNRQDFIRGLREIIDSIEAVYRKRKGKSRTRLTRRKRIVVASRKLENWSFLLDLKNNQKRCFIRGLRGLRKIIVLAGSNRRCCFFKLINVSSLMITVLFIYLFCVGYFILKEGRVISWIGWDLEFNEIVR